MPIISPKIVLNYKQLTDHGKFYRAAKPTHFLRTEEIMFTKIGSQQTYLINLLSNIFCLAAV